MEKRIEDKIEEIEEYLSNLIRYRPCDLDSYVHNEEKKAACERFVEKIVEAVVDLAYLDIKDKKFRVPETDLAAFDISKENYIISEVLAESLKDAIKMRNVLIHQYGEVDDCIMFDVINDKIESDVNEFISNVKENYS
jgi:uncharacterized protein YutE (UPF0331/DUF86 family)